MRTHTSPVPEIQMRLATFATARMLATYTLGLAAACSNSTEPTKPPQPNPPAPEPGQLSIWTNYSSPVSVSVDGGAAGTTTATFTNAPSCGESGTVTLMLSPGQHSIAASANGHGWSGGASVSPGQCTLYKLEAPQTPPPQTTGQLSIWTDNANPIAVFVDGTSAGSLATRFATAPACGASGTLTLTLPAGVHNISGSSGSDLWIASETVIGGQCVLHRLAAAATPPPPPPPQLGQLSVWTNYTSPIAVKVDGNAAGTLTTYFQNARPACGQAGTITVSVPGGVHAVSGLSGQVTWNGTISIIAGQCTLYELEAPQSPPPSATGQVSIWTDYPNQIGVRVDGNAAGTLTSYFSNGAPVCGQAGTLTLTLPAGAHGINGVSGSVTWNGTATVVAGQCTLYKLDAPAGGQISIWTNYPYQVAVNVDGASVGTLTSYFGTGTPTCGQAGTITVGRAAGLHSVTAQAGQVTWNGSVTVVAGQCTLYELRAP